MKILTRSISIAATLVIFAALLATPRSAFAAKSFSSLTASPASTNVLVGIATNVISTVTLANGSGGSALPAGSSVLLSASVTGPDATVTAGLNPTSGTIGKPGTLVSTLTVTTLAGTLEGTYTVTIVGTTNPPNSTLVNPITNYFNLVVSSGVVGTPIRVWTPAGVDTNWSTAANWTPAFAPVSTNDVQFQDTGAVGTAGTVNNVVDGSSTIASLSYQQTSSANYHTTLILPGNTLTLTGTNGLSAGSGTDADLATLNTIQGPGAALVVNNASANIFINQSRNAENTTATAQLDMSGLDTFTATVGRLIVGADLSIKGPSGVLKLAKTNTVTTAGAAPQLDVGDATLSQSVAGTNSILALGQDNTFFVDSVAVGRGKNTGNGSIPHPDSMLFNSAFSSPVAVFRGTGGASSRVGTWSVGDAANSKGGAAWGTNDFTLGVVDALVDTMFVGRGASVSGGSDGNGTLILSAGTMDVNTLEVGYADVGAGKGVVNVMGGSLVVNNSLELARGGAAVGTLNILGGAVTSDLGVTVGGGSATLTLNNGTLNATSSTAAIGTVAAPLTELDLSDSTLDVPVRKNAPIVMVNNIFSMGGTTNFISISSVPVISSLPAQFTVIQVNPSGFILGTFNIGLGTLPPGGYEGYISNNVDNSSVDLVLTAGPTTPILVWDGANSGDWDTTTQNWKTNGVLTTFQQGYALVQFDDTLTGTSMVSLTTALTNGSLTVINSLTNYTFAGTGKLSGGTSLTKDGTASLTLAESGGDDFSGGIAVLDGTLVLANSNTIAGAVTVNSGATLQVGNGGMVGNLPPGPVANAGTVVFSRADDLLVPNDIAGGALTQNSPSVLTLSGVNSAAMTVAQGTLKAGSINALGTAGVTVNSGATLDVNGLAFNNAEPISVAGDGVGGLGAIINSDGNQSKVLRIVTLAADTTLGGSGSWDISSSQSGSTVAGDAQLNGAHNLVKAGANTLTLFGVQVDSGLGDIAVTAGTLSIERNTTSLGDPAKTITVFPGATLQFQNASNNWNKVMVLKDGATFRNTGLSTTFLGPVTLESGAGTIIANAVPLALNNTVSGAGGLTKSGASTLTLSAAETYSGDTLVNGGTLALTGAGSLNTSANLIVAAGATLDASGRSDSTLTLASGQTLSGFGTVLGAVVVAADSTLAPGGSIGTLTVSNTLTLQSGSTTLMELSKLGGLTNDQVRGMSAVTYGGTLTVTGLGGAYVAGDTFKLFDATTYNASSFSHIYLPVGVVWDTSNLGVDGTIKVVSVAAPLVSSFSPGASGSYQLTFSGPAGNNYSIWASTNVAATPVPSTWTLLTNGLFDSTGTASFTDTGATNFPTQFYLISVP